jgi:hypothetical protein
MRNGRDFTVKVVRLFGAAAMAAIAVVLWSGPMGAGQNEQLKLPAEFATYRRWAQVLKEPYQVPLELWVRCMAPTEEDWATARKKYGPHTARYIRVYANPSAVAALTKHDRSALPVGAVIAKEKLSGLPHGDSEGVAFMAKRGKDKFPDTGGWEFLYFPSSGDARRTHESCASCHRSAASTDFVFGRYPR